MPPALLLPEEDSADEPEEVVEEAAEEAEAEAEEEEEEAAAAAEEEEEEEEEEELVAAVIAHAGSATFASARMITSRASAPSHLSASHTRASEAAPIVDPIVGPPPPVTGLSSPNRSAANTRTSAGCEDDGEGCARTGGCAESASTRWPRSDLYTRGLVNVRTRPPNPTAMWFVRCCGVRYTCGGARSASSRAASRAAASSLMQRSWGAGWVPMANPVLRHR